MLCFLYTRAVKSTHACDQDRRHFVAVGKKPTFDFLSVSMQELNIPRSDLVVSTKIFWGGKGPNDRGLSRKVWNTPCSHSRLALFCACLF